jgi:hypothetical protein
MVLLLSLLRYLLEYLLKGRKELEEILNKRLCKLLNRGTDILLIISIFLIR